MFQRRDSQDLNNRFNLGYNIYVPRGTFKTNKFPYWLIASGCVVIAYDKPLKIYHREYGMWVENPKQLMKWLHEQYKLNLRLDHYPTPLEIARTEIIGTRH